MASVDRLTDDSGELRGYKVRWRTAAGKARAKTFPLKRKGAADRFAIEVEADKLAGTELDRRGERLTVADYLEEWAGTLDHREGSALRVAHAVALLGEMFGDRPIRGIRESDIRSWKKGRRAQVGAGTVRSDFVWVRALFRAAVADRLIPSSPCDGVSVEAGEARQMVVPEPAGVLAIAARLPASWALLAPLAARSGLRPAELLGLCVEQIDFLRRTITVDRQMLRGRVILEPKTSSSRRTVPVDAGTVEMVSAHLAAFPLGPAVPLVASGDGQLIFHRDDGRPMSHRALNSTWARQAERAGLAGVRVHDMRHFYASQLIGQGRSVIEVSKVLGHARPSITADIYGHVTEGADDRVRDTISAIWANRAVSSVCPEGAEVDHGRR
jgi:integrase